MKKKTIFLLNIAILISVLTKVGPLGAVSSTSSPTSLPEPEDILGDNATVAGKKIEENKDEIIRIREEVKKKVEEKIRQVINRKSKRGWVGVITKKSAASIKLETRKGEREVLYDEDTTIINQRRKSVSTDELAVGKHIIAMGYLQSDTLLEAKRIVFIPQKEKEVRRVPVLGIISDKSREEKLLAITPVRNKNQLVEITTNNKTKIIGKNGQEITYKDLKKGQKVVAIYKKDGKPNATLALIIKVIALSEQTSQPTNSPTPSATQNR
jgi:hypothetical protein